MTLSVEARASLTKTRSATSVRAAPGVNFSQTGKSAMAKTAPQQTGMGPIANAVLDYPRLLAVFTAPHSADLADKRCASAVERVARVNAGGAAIRDLPFIEKLLLLAYDYINKSGTRALEAPLCNLMR